MIVDRQAAIDRFLDDRSVFCEQLHRVAESDKFAAAVRLRRSSVFPSTGFNGQTRHAVSTIFLLRCG